MTGEQVQKEKASTKETEAAVETAPVDLVDEELAEDVEDILAEIDEVLEENAAEFVRTYVQKGGQ